MPRLLFRLAAFGLAFVILILAWNGVSELLRKDSTPRPVTARGDLAADEQSTIELFERARDSVVFITTQAQVRDAWTRDVYFTPRGSGSGFIWDDAGHVITNYHVIEGASSATVKLADGRPFNAALVGASPAHDIAVLRIGVGFKRPPPVPIGSSGDLKVGQKVFAIGNPFGLDWTLTTGIISALNRSLGGDADLVIDNLIQTDAAINPGNSGGPLLDSAGRLIGINTAIYSPSGASAGIGFAVPVDTVNRVVPQLIAKGQYVRPTLGISVDEELNRQMSAALDFTGVAVLRVADGSAAAAAGLRSATMTREGIAVGDIITAVNGEAVDTVAKLLAVLDKKKIGETVKLSITRGDEKLDVDATLQAGN